jgi:hypothetical protein
VEVVEMKIVKTEKIARTQAALHSVQHGWAVLISGDGETVTYKNGSMYRIEMGIPVNVIGCGEEYYMAISEAKILGIR